MRQQTFIAILKDKDFNMVTLERFACKRAATVRNQMESLLQNGLYRVCTKEAVIVEIYATPDGYTKEPNPCICFNIK